MIVKYTAQYANGMTADFLSLEDLIAHDQAPHLHPDAVLTGATAPAEAPEAAPEATPEAPATPEAAPEAAAPEEVPPATE